MLAPWLHRLVRGSAASSASGARGVAPEWASASPCTAGTFARCSSAWSGQAAQPMDGSRFDGAEQPRPVASRDSATGCAQPRPSAVSAARTLQRRGFAALAEQCAEPDAGTNSESQQSHQQHSERGPVATAPAARRRTQLPSLNEVRARLRSGSGGACSSGSGLQPQQGDLAVADGDTLDWRRLVEALRRGQQAVPDTTSVLTDSFQRKHTYLRISLTERCNLRCLYCMPEDGVDLSPSGELLTSPEVLRLARLFAEAGVTKVRLTGGEPTLRRDVVELTAALAALPGVQDVGITTNGIALARKLPALHDAGLSLLNVSLDTLRPDRFEAMTRRRGLERVLATLQQAADMGYDPVKVNVVVMRGQNDDEILDFVELTRHAPLNVRFIEYMPFDGNVWAEPKMVTFRQMLAAVDAAHPGRLHRLQDPAGEVAKNYRVAGFRGTVSFVTSMTAAFCGDCNRLRLMADGNLKVCLFGANEVSLRDAMREGASDSELLTIISAAVDRKKAAHAGMFEIARTKNRSMVKIGG